MPITTCLVGHPPYRAGTGCPICKAAAARKRDQRRPSAHQRGYTREYWRNRHILLADTPQCHWCGKQATTEELQAYVKSRLAPYKYPRWIEFASELPKTATGKIQRFKLRT